jgi:zinc transporter ZupT
MDGWEYLVLVLAVLLGGGLAFFLRRRDEGFLGMSLAFTGAYLLAIVFLLLLPVIFKLGQPRMGLWVLAGFVLQLGLEPLSRGIEHGHRHTLEFSRKRPWGVIQVMIGLSLHAFLEGLPLTVFPELAEQHLDQSGNSLFWGIVLHKFPAAFALTTLFLQSRVRPGIVVACLLIFSAMSPLGSLIGARLPDLPGIYLPILGVVSGAFLHLATVILFESENNQRHAFNWYKAGFVLLGFATAVLTFFQ